MPKRRRGSPPSRATSARSSRRSGCGRRPGRPPALRGRLSLRLLAAARAEDRPRAEGAARRRRLRGARRAGRHLCCGSAGTYNLLQPELAAALRDRKLANIALTRADVVAAGNIGCITQLAGDAPLPVVHTVELLDWATGGPMPPALAAAGASGGAPAAGSTTTAPAR